MVMTSVRVVVIIRRRIFIRRVVVIITVMVIILVNMRTEMPVILLSAILTNEIRITSRHGNAQSNMPLQETSRPLPGSPLRCGMRRYSRKAAAEPIRRCAPGSLGAQALGYKLWGTGFGIQALGFRL